MTDTGGKGPNCISTTHIDAVAVVHGPKSTCTKKNTIMYDSIHVNGQYNLDGILDDKLHRERRAIWDKSLSMTCTYLLAVIPLWHLTNCPRSQALRAEHPESHA